MLSFTALFNHKYIFKKKKHRNESTIPHISFPLNQEHACKEKKQQQFNPLISYCNKTHLSQSHLCNEVSLVNSDVNKEVTALDESFFFFFFFQSKSNGKLG